MDIGVYGARGIPSTYSGFETFLTTLLPELVCRGHGVTMYCRRGEVPAAREFKDVRLRHLPALSTKSLSTLTHGAFASAAARRAGHDVVLVVNVANALFCAAATRTGQPVVLNTDGQEWLRRKWGPRARAFFLASAHRSGRAATAVVADCRAMADVYAAEFATPSTVIPYPWEGVQAAPDNSVLDDLALRVGDYWFLAGRLVPENGMDRVAEAFVASGAQRPLVIAGAANYGSPVERRLRELAAADPRIQVVGHVASRVKFRALQQQSFGYVHGHSVGGINPSLVEAMGCGARILSLDTAFNREALGPDGLFFGSWAELPPLFEQENPFASGYGSALRDRARSEYRLADVVTAYELLLETAAQAGARAREVRISTRWSPASFADRDQQP